MMDRWIKSVNGDLSVLSMDGKLVPECETVFFEMQDEYIALFGGDSIDMKRYKEVLVEYGNLLRFCIQEPSEETPEFFRLNELFMEKEELQLRLFKVRNEMGEYQDPPEVNYNEIVGRLAIRGIKLRLSETTAVEFFNVLKLINDGEGR